MKNKKIITLLLASAALAVSFFSISDKILTPYVSIQYAVEHHQQAVQVFGSIPDKSGIKFNNNEITFILSDKDKNNMQVIYKGIVPNNFSHADQMVVIGKYDALQKAFLAQKVLVKCPSKYEKKNTL